MKKIKVTADSICDLPAALLEKMNVTILPISILVEDKIYYDGVNISPSDIFSHMEAGHIPKTAASNPVQYTEFFSRFAGEYDELIHICISSGFSSCVQNARIAAQDFDNVYVVDSLNLSGGSGFYVCEAWEMAQQGKSAAEICEELQKTPALLRSSFLIDSVDFLYKGGRCSGLEALGAKVLNIKPSITLSNGKMRVGKKYRGSFEKTLEKYTTDNFEDLSNIDDSRIIINYTPCPEGTLEMVKEIIASFVPFQNVVNSLTGCTVASHCGPNTLGFFYKVRR